jgi:hypothetical protein
MITLVRKRSLSFKGSEGIVSFKEKFDPVVQEFKAHRVMNHPFWR